MQTLLAIWYRIVALFGRRRLDQEIDEELRFHLAMSEADKIAAGAPTDAARLASRRQFGRVTAIREDMRETWSFRLLEQWTQDLRYAVRTLRRTPGLAFVAIATLALGIGATTAVFSLVQETLLRPLPVRAPDRLVNLSAPGPKDGDQSSTQAGGTDDVFSYPMFRDLERAQTVFTSIAAHRLFDANLAHGGQTRHVKGMLVSGGYFPALTLQPAMGRLLESTDDAVIGEAHVAVLAHTYWKTGFGAAPDVVGQTLFVNGQPMTIVGVAPEGFTGTTLGRAPMVFVPITMRTRPGTSNAKWTNRRTYWLYLFARLKPGVTMEQASAALNVPYHAIINDVELPLNRRMYPDDLTRFKNKAVVISSGARGQSETPARVRPALTLLLGATACVLLIGCANIANLLLTRSAARASEMAVRLSIGASRGRLIAQLLVESSVLAVCGGVAGILLARWLVTIIPAFSPDTDPLVFSINGTVLLFAAAVIAGTSVAFGLFPALHGTRASLSSSLRTQAPISARSATRFRTTLATAQIALSLTLLVSAGLFVRSLSNISRINLGFNADRLVTFAISPALNGYAAERSRLLVERIEDALADTPGIVSATDGLIRLLSSDNTGNTVSVEGFRQGAGIDSNALTNDIGAGYFETIGIPLLSGREFTRADETAAPKVAIVNEAFAKQFNLGTNPVGKRMGDPGGPLVVEIVGLVRNAKYSEVKDDVPAQYFRPSRQMQPNSTVNLYVRSAGEPKAIMGLIPKIVAAIDPALPIEDVRSVPDEARANVALDRLVSLLSAAFAILATLLAGLGLYGVLAYTVAERRREIGVRMALGAAPGRVRAMVLGYVGRMTLVGSIVGLFGAFVAGRAAQTLLYGLDGSDPVVFVAATLLLAAVGALAGWMPAWRASRIDPAEILRQG